MRPSQWIIASFMLAQFIASASGQDIKSNKSIHGIWEGPLKAGAIELRLVFKFETADDALKATMDSPDQGAADIPVETAKFDGSKVAVEISKLKCRYAGEMTKDGQSINGTFTQAGMIFPLNLRRVDKVASINRPQTPLPPFPYQIEEVVVENQKAADVKLSGTLSLPNGKGPFPAAILISGSGPQDRDESILSHKPFAVIADHLARRGIAVLRCDDRGVGKSTGNHAEATSADFATDVAACFEYLKSRSELDRKKIGLIGHSEGGLIAPMVAAENSDVAFIVMMAGPGVPGIDIVIKQGDLISAVMGASESGRKWSRELNLKLFAALNEKTDEQEMLQLIDKTVASLPEEVKKGIAKSEIEATKASVKMLCTPWFRFFAIYDPRPTLAKVKCPVLAINGELDLQVAPQQNLPEIEQALKAGGNTDFTILEIPKLNHLFQRAKTGSPAEYVKIEETISMDALNVISEWILKRD